MDRNRFDPEVYEFYRNAIENTGFSGSITVDKLEQIREAEVSGHLANMYPYDVTAKRDLEIDCGGGRTLPARVYIPEVSGETEGPLPVILYFHGGGFIMGSIEDHDPLCGKLADACKAVLVAPEYRLAPEDLFPACIEDAVCTAEWVKKHAPEFGADPDRIIVSGDSSGATISAALALLARKGEAPEIAGMILFYGIYGCVDIAGSGSGLEFGQGDCVLPVSAIDQMMKLYVPAGTDPCDIRLNPGKAQDLSDMPPSVIVTAELDPLRDDGEAFAGLLKEAGNTVRLIRAEGMMHGFILYWQRFHRAEELIDEIGRGAWISEMR